MKELSSRFFSVVFGVSLILASPFVFAQSDNEGATAAPADASESRWGDSLGKVTLNESAVTVEAALISISKQAGLGLALTASKEDLERPLTLMISERPAGEVLDIIQASTPLELEMKNGILVVRSKTSPPPPTPSKVASPASDTDEKMDSKEPTGERGWFEHRRWHPKHKKKVEFGGPVVVDKNDRVHSAVSIGGTTTIFGHVDKDAVAVGGTVVVKTGAVVEGTAVAIGGPVIIEPGAVVEEKAVSVGNEVKVAEGGEIQGDQVSIPIPLPALGGMAGAMGGLVVLHIIGAIARSLILLGLALLLIWLIPKRVQTVQSYMTEKPGISILSGFLVFLALVPLFIVLAVTIIGIPLIPVAGLVLAALIVLGLTGLISWLGYRIPLFKETKTPVKAILIGFAAFLLINIIPILGGLFMMVALFAGVGAAFQSRFGSRPKTA